MEGKKKNGLVFGFIAAIVVIAVVLIGSATFVVHQNEYVTVRRFGKIVSIVSEPGLHFKTPFIEDTQSISGKVIIYDIPASDVITKDKKSMITDTYVLWRVTDPLKYVQTLNALSNRAEERIEASVYNATKNAISSMSQDEVIEARGETLTGIITTEANSDMEGYGISIIQAQIKALDLPDDNKNAVYERMISERNNIAASYTAQGEAEAQKIHNETDKQVAIVKAKAQKDAAVLEAEGEAEYMKTLSEAYNTEEKAEFYNYMRGLDALKASLSGDKTIILDKNSELAKILYGNFN
ncbi:MULTISPECIES: protease modulator HflC [unclassified Butyrivibrio]|uniref:protease modulator HflC n=1 Tax=unclassified Butyrivibrio TaxID=2639466 RepID=UPI0004188313|nr:MULTISPECIES: protease modulator HflC [unclassified Butyrivibrio]SCY20930.1 membrane protease subunit HflC [Butyrivibrio sp. INlla14]